VAYTTSFRFDSVCVIESIREGDLGGQTGTSLVESVLVPLADQVEIKVFQVSVHDRAELLQALRQVDTDIVALGHSPIIHLESHGNEDGLVLASDDLVTWRELGDALTPINHRTHFNLLVVLALCSGYHFSSALLPTQPSPAWAIVGSKTEVWSSELFAAMKAFYDTLLTSLDSRAAFYAMNQGHSQATGQYEFLPAELLFCSAFSHYIAVKCTAEQLREREQSIVATIVRWHGYDLNVAMMARHDATIMMRDHAKHFLHLRQGFFMLDEYPENAPRFALTIDNCGGGAT
jgi:hypothetical protein